MKKKIVVLVGITLCTMLLISPALASGVDTLEIYGNANEDDTIDMRDLTYVKLIFFGKKPETELADAKYDGKINPLDFIQIKLIIVGKEKELTFIDSADRIVTVNKPIERAVVCAPNRIEVYHAEVMRALKVQDKIVGVSSYIAKKKIYFPELSKLPNVGSKDYEAMLNLNPDLVFMGVTSAVKAAEKLPGIPVVGFYPHKTDTLIEELEKLGYIFGRKEEAQKFIDFYEGYTNTIEERTEGISEEDRPRVYLEKASTSGKKWSSSGSKSGYTQKIEMAGGNNIFGDNAGSRITVDPEEVIKRDPEVILVRVRDEVGGGYASDDITELSEIRDEIMNRPELAEVTAVKNKKVYVFNVDILGGVNYLPGTAYLGKWFHPNLFEDLDPRAIHQEYLTEFQGLDYDLDEHGVFVYHPEEHPGGY